MWWFHWFVILLLISESNSSEIIVFDDPFVVQGNVIESGLHCDDDGTLIGVIGNVVFANHRKEHPAQCRVS